MLDKVRSPVGEIMIGETRVYDWAMNFAISCARAAGHEAEKVHAMRLVVVNDHFCSFQSMRYCFTGEKARRSYTKAMITLSTIRSVDACIFCSVVPGTAPKVFVIPSAVLRKTCFDEQPKHHATLWFPIERLPSYKNMHSKLPYWDYESAWPARS